MNDDQHRRYLAATHAVQSKIMQMCSGMMQMCSCGNPGRIKLVYGRRGEPGHCAVACWRCWRIVLGAMRLCYGRRAA
jgi:hypothetical protein